jgi:hypothetical protein
MIENGRKFEVQMSLLNEDLIIIFSHSSCFYEKKLLV